MSFYRQGRRAISAFTWIAVHSSTSCPCVTSSWSCTTPLRSSLRGYQTLQRGYEMAVQSLFGTLGMENQKRKRHHGGLELSQRVMHCTERELQEAFMEQASKLKDPEHNPDDRAKLEALKDAVRQLLDSRFRSQYRAHHCSSNDAILHVLQDGGDVGANFNPEHQQFCFEDHSQPAVDSGVAASAGGVSPLEDVGARASVTNTMLDADHGTGYGLGSGSSASKPRRGADIALVLRANFLEGWSGGSREIHVPKDTTCTVCSGSGGSGKTGRRRRCPQCFGRGSVSLPSATYQISKTCTYCDGEGLEPERPCAACHGLSVRLAGGLRASRSSTASLFRVVIPRRTTAPATTFRLRGRGHDGRYGGPPGDVVLTLLVASHPYFHCDPATEELHIVVPVPLSSALLGGLVEIPKLDPTDEPVDRRVAHSASERNLALRVPPGVTNGQQMRVTVRTVEKGGESTTVTVVAHCLVHIPQGHLLSGRQRSALRAYEANHQEVEALNGARAEAEKVESLVLPDGCDRELWNECAELKSRYAHWLAVP